MKHKPYTCDCCGDKTKRARGVEVTNMDNPTLCDNCNLKLCIRGELLFRDKIVLILNKDENHQEGDTTNATAWTYEKPDYWESRRRVAELDAMNGFDAILGNPSY